MFIYDKIYLSVKKDLKEKNLFFLKYSPYLLGIIFQHQQKLSEGAYNAETFTMKWIFTWIERVYWEYIEFFGLTATVSKNW